MSKKKHVKPENICQSKVSVCKNSQVEKNSEKNIGINHPTNDEKAKSQDDIPNALLASSFDILSEDSGHIVVGKFGKTHGLDGKIFIHSYTDPVDNLFNYEFLLLGDKSRVSFLTHHRHGKHIICHLSGVDTVDDARALTNQMIYLSKEHLEKLPDGQYYWHELSGCDVIGISGHCFGKVDYLYEGSQFPIMMVRGEHLGKKKEHLIPYEPSTVRSVDIDKNVIVVDWLID